VIDRFHRLGRAGRSDPVKIAQSCFLFVSIAIPASRLPHMRAAGARCFRMARCGRGGGHGLFLPRRAAAPFELSQQPPDGAATRGVPSANNRRANSRSDRLSTARRRASDRPRCTLATGGGGSLRGRLRDGSLWTPPLFSDAPSRRILCLLQIMEALTNGFRIARQNLRDVLDPTIPSLVASTRYRRRSFSDSQPKKRCIFRSTSAAYPAMPPSCSRTPLNQGYYDSSNPGSYS